MANGRRFGSKISCANSKDSDSVTLLTIGAGYQPMKMEQTECSETSAYKIQTPGNYPKENIQHTEQGKSLKSKFFY